MLNKQMKWAILSATAFGTLILVSTAPLGAQEQPDDESLAPTITELGTLPPRELSEGQCGLFLWADVSNPRLVFSSERNGSAQMIINGEEVTLARNAAEGRQYFGQFESQHFYSPNLNISLNMVIEQRPAMPDGAVVPSGTLRMIENSGWETVMPIGGVIGCVGS